MVTSSEEHLTFSWSQNLANGPHYDPVKSGQKLYKLFLEDTLQNQLPTYAYLPHLVLPILLYLVFLTTSVYFQCVAGYLRFSKQSIVQFVIDYYGNEVNMKMRVM